MSLAEQVPQNDTHAHGGSASASKIDNILRLALSGGGQRALGGQKQPELDFGAASELLDRATGAITMLTARRSELERAAEVQEEQLQTALDHAAEWERRAKVIKGQLQDCENRLSEQQIRIETLTYRAETAEARAAMAEQAAADARKQSQMYHDKIVSALGPLA